MSFKLLALDLDGTLLRRDHTVDPRDIAAIAELQRAGVTVTIATGRLQSGSVGAARACAIEGLIACCEGSHLVELATNTTRVRHALPDDLSTLMREVVHAHGLSPFVFDAHGIHHDDTGHPFASYVATWSPNLRVLDRATPWQAAPLAAVAIGTPEAVEAAHALLRPHADRLFAVAFPVYSHPGQHAILVRAAGPTKGTALAQLCEAAGCTLADAVVVGDWLNDVPMFRAAGRSFAMGGVPASVADHATDQLVAPSGDGGGVAETIRRAWG